MYKAIVVLILVTAAGAGSHQAFRASRLQTQAKLEEERQKPDSERNARLLGELASITNQIAAARQENRKLHRLREEVSKLRVERDRLHEKTIEISRARALERSRFESDIRQWLDKTKSLKQCFEAWPGKKSPELLLLTEEDWLSAVANRRLDTERDFRSAMADLRKTAKIRFAELVPKALRQFTKSNKHQYPSELSQLKPYFNLPEDSPILEGFEIAKPGTVRAQIPSSSQIKAEKWALVEKGGVADKDYDMYIVIYDGGWFGGPATPGQ